MPRPTPLLAVAVLLLAACAPTPSGAVTPIVTYAGLDPNDDTYVSVSGVVTGIAETGGRCSFTFWAHSGAATRLSGTGTADGDHTNCGPELQGLGFMVGGTYTVELKYEPLDGDAVTGEKIPLVLPTPDSLN